MKFEFRSGTKLKGKSSYSGMELEFEPEDPKYTSGSDIPRAVLVVSKTIQIEFTVNDGQLLYAWGYLPVESMQTGSNCSEVNSVEGQVYVLTEAKAVPGSGYDTTLIGSPATYFKDSNKILIGNVSQADNIVEISTNTFVGLKDDQLCCLLIKL